MGDLFREKSIYRPKKRNALKSTDILPKKVNSEQLKEVLKRYIEKVEREAPNIETEDRYII